MADQTGVTAGSTPSDPPGHWDDSLFVGRQAEMATLQAALEDVLAGRGRLVLLGGEPGIGKTRTVQEFVRHAGARGGLVLWGRCAETPGAPPYWPWSQILRTYGRTHDAAVLRAAMGVGAVDLVTLAPAVREYLTDLPTSVPIEDPEQARFRLFTAMTAFLQQAAQRQPLVLVLENLHGADKPSLLLLEFLAQESVDSRVLVIGTYRDIALSRQHPLTDTLAELGRERTFQHLHLRGLTREDIRSFVTATADGTSPQALVEALQAQTEGNPLFLTEIVRLLRQESAATSERWYHLRNLRLMVPDGIRAVIGKRLNRLSPPCLHLLTMAAVIGREFALRDVGALLDDLPREQLLPMLEEALEARLIEEAPQMVGHCQFTHVLIRETLYDELAAVRRTHLHRRVGEALERLYATNVPAHLAQLAHHFYAARHDGPLDKAVLYAERAGVQAEAALAYEAAAQHYDMALQALALQEPVDEAGRCRLLLALGTAYRKAGIFDRALAVFQQVAELATRLGAVADLARAALGFEETSWRPGLPGEAAVQLLEAANSALGTEESILKARVLGGLARALVFAGSLAQGVSVGQQAVAMARRTRDAATLAATLRTHYYYMHSRPEDVEARLQVASEVFTLAETAGDKDMALEAASWRLVGWMERGDLDRIDLHFPLYRRDAEELRQPFYLYVCTSFRAMRAVFDGRLAEGEQLAQEAFDIGQRLRGQDASGSFGIQMFTVCREQGRLRELAPLVQHFVQTSPEHTAWRPGLAVIYSELGLLQEARSAFERLAVNDFADIPQDAIWLACIVYLAEVCTALGDAARAATLYRLLAPCARQNIVVCFTGASYGAATRYLGMLAATMTDWSQAQAHFEEALAMNTRLGAHPWLAHTQYQYAAMLLARGQRRDHEYAQALLASAWQTSQALGMHALAARIGTHQASTRPQVPPAPVYPAGLTQREVEVLRLLAAGKSNRDIAEALFVSPNTVANHVRSILAKTTTANRTEAAAYARRHDLLAEDHGRP